MNDPNRLIKFADKVYRDSYLRTRVGGYVAQQIRALRQERGLSQRAFADRIQTRQSVVSRLENPEYGRLNIHTLVDIACALDVALIVKFASYPEFLGRLSDFSDTGLKVASIFESIAEPRPGASVLQSGRVPMD